MALEPDGNNRIKILVFIFELYPGKVFEFCSPRANYMIADIYFRQGAYSLALEYFNIYTDSKTSSPEIQLWKAICLIQLRRYLEALRIIESFNSGSHLYPLAMLNKLFCFWVQGKKQKVRSIVAELRALGLAEDTDKVLTLFLNAQDIRKNAYRVTLGQDGAELLLDIIKRFEKYPDIEVFIKLSEEAPVNLLNKKFRC